MNTWILLGAGIMVGTGIVILWRVFQRPKLIIDMSQAREVP